jgi:hypothetical protein
VDLETATSALDTLSCYRAHNFTTFDEVTEEQFAELTAVVEYKYREMMVDRVLRIQISKWMTALSESLSNAAAGTSSLKFIHWSAHDSTLMPAQATLQLWNGKGMSYAAHMAVELRRARSGMFYVQVFVGDDEPGSFETPQPLSFCDNRVACPLEIFQAHLVTYDGANLNEWCGGNVVDGENGSSLAAAVMILAIGLSVVTLLAAKLAVKLKRRGRSNNEKHGKIPSEEHRGSYKAVSGHGA